MSKRRCWSYLPLLLAAITLILNLVAIKNPLATETLYSQGIYPVIQAGLTAVFARFSFGVGQIIAVLFVVGMIIYVLKLLWAKQWHQLLLRVVQIGCMLYVAFMLLWGFNYCRLPLGETLGWEIQPATVAELQQLTDILVQQVNQAALQVHHNNHGLMVYDYSIADALKQGNDGYRHLSGTYPWLDFPDSRGKAIFFSSLYSYTGIGGIYLFYTGEPNVNIDMAPVATLYTLCHEEAHRRGFAREDEANFLSYLACRANVNADFQYAGALLAFINAGNALYGENQQLYRQSYSQLSDSVKQDLSYISWYWQSFQGPVEKVTNFTNDTYLKITGAADGVKSYGRMVDLLLAGMKQGLIEKNLQ